MTSRLTSSRSPDSVRLRVECCTADEPQREMCRDVHFGDDKFVTGFMQVPPHRPRDEMQSKFRSLKQIRALVLQTKARIHLYAFRFADDIILNLQKNSTSDLTSGDHALPRRRSTHPSGCARSRRLRSDLRHQLLPISPTGQRWLPPQPQ